MEVETILPELDDQPSTTPSAATAERAPFRLSDRISDSGRRLLFILAGALLIILSVLGFYFTSSAFDDRVSVLVAAVEIPKGSAITSNLFTEAKMQVDSVEYIPYSPANLSYFEGLYAAYTIPPGAVMRYEMAFSGLGQPVGDELELLVPMDASLASVSPETGDIVLLVDSGIPPSSSDPGRPRQVLQTMVLRDFDGSAERMLLPPEEWSAWRTMLSELESTLLVMPVPPGGDAETWGQRLDAVWQSEHSRELAKAEELQSRPLAGPGELELVVPLNTSLAPSGVVEGERALLIDPGVAPTSDNRGRPRQVIRNIVIRNFESGAMRLFLPPVDWIEWQTLLRDLNAVPMVLPLPPGTDSTGFSNLLNSVWSEAYDADLRDFAVPERVEAASPVQELPPAPETEDLPEADESIGEPINPDQGGEAG